MLCRPPGDPLPYLKKHGDLATIIPPGKTVSEYDFELSEEAKEGYKLRKQERSSALKEMRAWSAMFYNSTGRLSFDDLLAIPTDTCFRALRAGELIQWLTLVAAPCAVQCMHVCFLCGN